MRQFGSATKFTNWGACNSRFWQANFNSCDEIISVYVFCFWKIFREACRSMDDEHIAWLWWSTHFHFQLLNGYIMQPMTQHVTNQTRANQFKLDKLFTTIRQIIMDIASTLSALLHEEVNSTCRHMGTCRNRSFPYPPPKMMPMT